MLDFSEDVTPEATAWAVKFLSHQHPDSPLLPKAALWLMLHRNEGYWWESTKQTAMVIYGLTDYLRHTGELKPNFTATVFVNDKAVLAKKIDQAIGLAAPDLTMDESKLPAGANHIRIATSGSGRLYYSARAEYYSGDEKLQKAGTTSLNILRDYFRLTPSRTGDKIVYDLAPLDGPLASGDTIAVRLTVTGSDWRYLMIEDPIPAGTEFIETRQLLRVEGAAALVGVLLYAPRAARQPYGAFPDVLPARPAAVFLPAESGEPGRVPGEPGARGADVSERCDGDYRKPQGGGEVMRSTGLFAGIHLAGNALLLWLGYYWLGLGESRAGALLWSLLVAALVGCLACWLYGAGFAFFAERRVWAAFRAALRNLAPLVVAAIAVVVVYALAGARPRCHGQPGFPPGFVADAASAQAGEARHGAGRFPRGVLGAALGGRAGADSAHRAGHRVARLGGIRGGGLAMPPLAVLAGNAGAAAGRGVGAAASWWDGCRTCSSFGGEMTSFVVRAAVAYLLFAAGWLGLAFVTAREKGEKGV